MKSGKIGKISIPIMILVATGIIGVGIGTMISPTGPYTGCISNSTSKNDTTIRSGVGEQTGMVYNFKPGNNPTSSCKNGDYQITLYEKTYIDNVTNSLLNKISDLDTRIGKLENNTNKSYVLTYVGGIPNASIGPGVEIIGNYTYYLDKTSYVIIQSQGQIVPNGDIAGDNMIALVIDKNADDIEICNCWDPATRRDYYGVDSWEYQTWGAYRLDSGYHNVYVIGHSGVESNGGKSGADVIYPITITITVNQI